MRRLQHALIGLVIVTIIVAIAYAQGPVMSPAGPVWDDLVMPTVAVNPSGADGDMTLITSASDYIGCLQADASGETMTMQFQLSHGQQPDSDIRPHVHWIVGGADVTGSAVFEGKFRHCPLVGACGAWSEWAAGTVEIEPADVADATGLTAWTLSDATYNFDISSVVIAQFRLASLTVTKTITCSADIHYRRSSGGTRLETTR